MSKESEKNKKSKRVRKPWMELDDYNIETMSDEDWDYYSRGKCMCSAFCECECVCGAWRDGN